MSDWTKWSENNHNNPKAQLMVKKRSQVTRVFTSSRKMSVKTHDNKILVSQKTSGENPASRNDSISKVAKVVNASCNSIPLHNRFDMFNNTVLFPENVCESATCEQKVVCLRNEKRGKQSNVDKIGKTISKTVSNELIANQETETKRLMQGTMHDLSRVTKCKFNAK